LSHTVSFIARLKSCAILTVSLNIGNQSHLLMFFNSDFQRMAAPLFFRR
jgi:hypothetical protein